MWRQRLMVRLIAALLGVALLTAAVLTVLWVVITGIVVFGVCYIGSRAWRAHRARVAARVHRRAELLARAEIQHRWFLAGDERGIYGRYPPRRMTG
jgi:hypothetical protein